LRPGKTARSDVSQAGLLAPVAFEQLAHAFDELRLPTKSMAFTLSFQPVSHTPGSAACSSSRRYCAAKFRGVPSPRKSRKTSMTVRLRLYDRVRHQPRSTQVAVF
jgi:hypothetical protein